MSGQNHAIVIGASMGGLLAARALADFYQQVTLIERDAFPPIGENRKGVPQGQHLHVLLLRGSEILEGMFPGLIADMMARGVPLLDRPEKELIWFDGGGYHARFTNEDGRLGSLAVSRPLLEGYVRQRLLALPNVTAIEQCDALGLVPSERAGRVRGVRLVRRAGGSAEEVLEADLVVDASGRGSRAPRWLEEMGYTPPEEEQVTMHVGYSTRIYRRRPEHLNGAKAVVITPQPPQLKRLGVILAQEGERWIVGLGGALGDYPPSDEEGFLAFARSLAAPEIYNVIKDAEPLSEIVTYRFKASRRRRYEKLTRFPEGFLVFGDAICSFNPIYGQGMSVAAMEALDLQHELRRGGEGLWRRFFRRAARSIDNPWQIVVSKRPALPGSGRETHTGHPLHQRLHGAAAQGGAPRPGGGPGLQRGGQPAGPAPEPDAAGDRLAGDVGVIARRKGPDT
ncbi:MAG: FAD-binding monooxygenase [Gemmatimonadales bacterium]|nr:MAG: FAD-binding monooxygenase [Gemmatimonadales bacterium]